MKNIMKYKFEFITVGLMMLILFGYYHKILLSPNSYLMSSTGDGLKNYYTIIMQVKSDEFINFSYYNYPFGEYFFNTDGFPLLVALLKPVQAMFPETYNYVPGILHILLFLSMIFCSLFIFKTLKLLKTPELLAVLSAIAITLLQPQLSRMGGHYALAFSHVIPLSFYLSLKYLLSNQKTKYAIYIFLHGLLSIFIHPYIGMIAFSSIIPILGFWLANNKNFKNRKYLLQIISATLSPALIYKIFTFLTDSVIDKNHNPSGFHDFKAEWFTVFIPQTEFFYNIFQLDIKLIETKWEAASYIGLFTTIILLPSIVYFIISHLTKNKKSNYTLFSIGLLITSILFLTISFGFPFYGSWSEYYQKIPLFREFRAIGRLAWVFYFGSCIFIISTLSVYYNKFQKNGIASHLMLIFLFIIPFSYVFEAHKIHKNHSNFITQSPNLFIEKTYSEEFRSKIKNINKDNFQAIIPMPYFYVGTEIFDVFRGINIQDKTILASKLTDLPLLTNFSGRSSFSIARKIIRIIENQLVYRDLSEQFKDFNKDFLIIYSYDELITNEKNIISKATFIDSTEHFAMYRISPQILFEYQQTSYPQDFQEYQNKNHWWTKDSNDIIFANDFEDGNPSYSFTGKASYGSQTQLYHILYEFSNEELQLDSLYSASFWIKQQNTYIDFAGLDLIAFINRFDTISQVTYWDYAVSPSKSVLSYNGWSLVRIDFAKKCSQSKYSLVVKGKDGKEEDIFIDHLLIQKMNSKAYKNINDSIFFINNYVQSKTNRPFVYE